MRTLMIVLGLCGLAWSSAPASEQDKQDKDAVVREIKVPGFKGLPKGNPKKPTVITNAEELAKTFLETDRQEAIQKQVDFAKDKLLFFAWSGSGGDRLTPTVDKGKDGPAVTFAYSPGLTRDLRAHVHLYAIPKGATWTVEVKRGK
ncbi:MAG: hypothetical protein L0Z62_20460 [Gemmataceae bacterium]|nr:hypothetical protein [Gemmataceae bacterium]